MEGDLQGGEGGGGVCRSVAAGVWEGRGLSL